MLKNFLTSGFDFEEEDFEIKLHYYLYNSILVFIIVMLAILAYVRVLNGNILQAIIDIVVVFISAFSIYFLRKSKSYKKPITSLLLIMFFFLVCISFLNTNSHIVGTSWFIVFLFPSFFLGGKKEGVIASISSFLAIVILGQFVENKYDTFEYAYVLMPFVMSVIFIILYDERNIKSRILLQRKNISLKKEIEKEILEKAKLTQQSQELGDIIEKSNIELYIVNFETNQYMYANFGAVKESGYSQKEFLNMSIFDINPYINLEEVEKLKHSAKEKNIKSISYIATHRRKDESKYKVQSFIHEIQFDGKKAFVSYSVDISEREKAKEELLLQKDLLNHQAYHDSLTNLPNRALFMDRLRQAMYKSQRHKKLFAVFFIDLDEFKQINDSLGHEAGDSILKSVASRLCKVLRTEDTLCRIGGDEFTILAEDIASVNTASVIAQKLISAMKEFFIVQNQELFVTCSIGISLYPKDAKEVSALLRNADAAMYNAKKAGKNTFSFYEKSMTKNAFERVVMETSLRRAIREDEFVVYYQPQYEISTGQIIGMEALTRWQHPLMGLLQPSSFIPLAEENGMIVEIDSLIADKAIKDFVLWEKDGLNPGKLNLNLTVKQLMNIDFISTLKEKLYKNKMDPVNLIYEIIERQIMFNPKAAIKKLQVLNDLGIKIAIDDFGTGYSSLSYLTRLPIHKIKIDKSFIDGVPNNDEDSNIVKTIIMLCKNLKLDVMAEGIETIEQRDFILKNGCNYIQGFLYSYPICERDMRNLLGNHRANSLH